MASCPCVIFVPRIMAVAPCGYRTSWLPPHACTPAVIVFHPLPCNCAFRSSRKQFLSGITCYVFFKLNAVLPFLNITQPLPSGWQCFKEYYLRETWARLSTMPNADGLFATNLLHSLRSKCRFACGLGTYLPIVPLFHCPTVPPSHCVTIPLTAISLPHPRQVSVSF